MKPGIYRDFDDALYRSDPCEAPSLNQSTAKVLLNESPWHAWKQHPRLGGCGQVPTRAMDKGTVIHALLLGQSLDNLHVIDAKDYRKDAAKLERDDAKAAGKVPMLQREMGALTEAVPVIRDRLHRLGYDFQGDSEVTMVWSIDGTQHRCRADHLEESDGWILDLKSTADANPQSLDRLIVAQDYHLQAAAEIEALETLRPDLQGRVRFVDVFFELEYPYWCVDIEHTESMLELGRHRWERARRIWQQCLDSGAWNGYKEETGRRAPLRAFAPPWAYNKEFGEVA